MSTKLLVQQDKKFYKKSRLQLLLADFLKDKGFLRVIGCYLFILILHSLNHFEILIFLPVFFQSLNLIFGAALIGMIIYVLTNLVNQYADIKKDLAHLYEGQVSLAFSEQGIRINAEGEKAHQVYWYKMGHYQILKNTLFLFSKNLNGPLILIPKKKILEGSFTEVEAILQQKLKPVSKV